MPELRFRVRWPDGRDETCYSPSTILREHLDPGQYALSDFIDRARLGLQAASSRVEARYGIPCSRAIAQIEALEAEANRHDRAAPVTVVSIG